MHHAEAERAQGLYADAAGVIQAPPAALQLLVDSLFPDARGMLPPAVLPAFLHASISDACYNNVAASSLRMMGLFWPCAPATGVCCMPPAGPCCVDGMYRVACVGFRWCQVAAVIGTASMWLLHVPPQSPLHARTSRAKPTTSRTFACGFSSFPSWCVFCLPRHPIHPTWGRGLCVFAIVRKA